jgi:hypothetical protein
MFAAEQTSWYQMATVCCLGPIPETDPALNELAGNQASLPAASDYVWTFTTSTVAVAEPVAVLSTQPEDGTMACSFAFAAGRPGPNLSTPSMHSKAEQTMERRGDHPEPRGTQGPRCRRGSVR